MLRRHELSRPRLLRLLNELDATPVSSGITLALPPGTPLPDGIAFAPNGDELRNFIMRSPRGAFVFAGPSRFVAVSPPFPVGAPYRAEGYRTEPLRQNAQQHYRLGAVLVRYGGYAIGVVEDGRLVAARNDSRFVKNRHRKGGQSQRRFERIREKQIHELFAHCCEDATALLESWRGRLDWLAYGGDAHTVQAFLKACAPLRDFPARVLPRFFSVPEPRHETLERLPELIASTTVLEWRAEAGL